LLERNFCKETAKEAKRDKNEKRGHFNRGKEGDILKEL
jgi:hypothetical protein